MGLLVSLGSLLLLLGSGFGWLDPPRMHNPTLTTVTVAAVPAQACEIQVQWGAGLGGPVTTVRADALYQYVVPGLAPGRVTDTTVFARPIGATEWVDSTPLSLRTLKPASQSVRFGIAADTHAWALYSQLHGGVGGLGPFGKLNAAIHNLTGDGDLDFTVVLTDSAMTDCPGVCAALSTAAGDASDEGIDSLEDALARYRMVWGVELLGRVAAAHPVFVLNGDHEGESGYEDADTKAWSSAARQATLPTIGAGILRGPPGTLAFAFETGPVLIVALDLHSLSDRPPTAPEQWHLGAAQHEWLGAVLGASRKPWKIVMAEHLVGGISDPATEHWKGRGGITATDDGTPTGTFLGEQALVHATMLAAGADLFVSAHDHVVAWGSKDGIAYLIAGRAGGVGNPWIDDTWYREAMDYDGDGIPEFASNTTGTTKPGHVVIEADAQHMTIDYVNASTTLSQNGKTILEFTLDHDGR